MVYPFQSLKLFSLLIAKYIASEPFSNLKAKYVFNLYSMK